MQGYQTDIMYGDIHPQVSTAMDMNYRGVGSSNSTTNIKAPRASSYSSGSGSLQGKDNDKDEEVSEEDEEDEEDEDALDTKMRCKWFPKSLLDEAAMRKESPDSLLLSSSDGVYALLYFLLSTDEGFTSLVDNLAPPPSLNINEDATTVLSSISKDANEEHEGEETSLARSHRKGHATTKQESTMNAREVRFARRYCLKAPRILDAIDKSGIREDVNKYGKMIDRAVTIEHLKLQGKGPDALRRQKEKEEEEEGEEEGSYDGSSLGNETWAVMLERLSATSNSAVKAVWETTNITSSLPSFGTPYTEAKKDFPSTPERSIASPSNITHDINPKGQYTTPGVSLFGTAIPPITMATPDKKDPAHKGARTEATQIKMLQTDVYPEDAARLDQFSVLRDAKDKAPGSIARYTQDLREVHSELSIFHQLIMQVTNKYDDLVQRARTREK